MPGRFRFNLQAVLEHRERIEEEHQRRLAAIDRERISVEDRLRSIQRDIAQARSDMREHLCSSADSDGQSPGNSSRAGTVRIRDVRFQAGASLWLTGRAQSTALELAGIYRRLESARAELMRVTTDRKAVELLRDKRLAEWRMDQSRREAAATDEISTMRAGRTTA